MNEMTAVRAPAPHLVLLVALSALQPMALNIIAPSTPELARQFNTDYATVQLTLTAYLIAVATSQLITGPWSDRSGRRPVVLFGCATFLVGCLFAAIAPTIEALIFARVVQAIGSGTTFAMARAVIRDTSQRDEAASRIGYMMVAMLVVPMLSPTVGSLIDRFIGWQAIFFMMAVVGTISLALVWTRLPETNITRDAQASFGKLASAFPTLLSNRAFLAYTLSVCATSGLFFSFVAGAPHVVVVSMRQAPEVYALWFIVLSGGYTIGNFLAGRFAGRLGSERLIIIGTWVTLVAMVVQAAWAMMAELTLSVLFVPAFLVTLGNGITIPGASASALSVRPDLAGSAAGLSGALQLWTAAAVSWLTGHIVTSTPKGLIGIMLACAIAGALALMIPRTLPKQ